MISEDPRALVGRGERYRAGWIGIVRNGTENSVAASTVGRKGKVGDAVQAGSG